MAATKLAERLGFELSVRSVRSGRLDQSRWPDFRGLGADARQPGAQKIHRLKNRFNLSLSNGELS
jgi:hypothetical protein